MRIVTIGKDREGKVNLQSNLIPSVKTEQKFLGIDGFGEGDTTADFSASEFVDDYDPSAPAIRLVIPTYNYGKYLRKCLDGLLRQSFADWVCCIVDDHSTDNTPDILSEYTSKDSRLRSIRNDTNIGTGASLNAGFRTLPKTKYETWFAADNIMYPNMLEHLYGAIENSDELVSMVYSDYDIGYESTNGQVLKKVRGSSVFKNVGLGMEYNPAVLRRQFNCGIAWLWNRALREYVGDFSTSPCEDYDMTLRLESKARLMFVDEVLAYYRSHPDNMTNKFRRNLRSSTPTIRIVVPTYNYGKFLGQCLESIQNQTFTNWVCCVVDDHSTDNTRAVAERFLADSRFSYEYNDTNIGTGASLNVGFSCLPQTKYETWFAADNVMYPNMLEELYTALERDHDAVMAYSDFVFYDTNSDPPNEYRATSVQQMEYVEDKILTFCYVGVCYLWRAQIRTDCGPFETDLCEDYDMHLRLAERGPFVFVDKVLGLYRIHSGNLSAKILKEGKARNYEEMYALRYHNRRRKRKPKLKILSVNFEFDCAGVGWRLKKAFQEYSDMEIIHTHGQPTPWCPQTDYVIDPNDKDTFINLVKKADVIHFNEWNWNYKFGSNFFESMSPQFSPTFDIKDILKDKRVIFHAHGGPLQLDPQFWLDACHVIGALPIVCDPLTESIIEGTIWMPNVLNINEIGEGVEQLHNGVDVHTTYASPAVEHAKGVRKLREVFDYLHYRGYNIKWREIHSLSWRDAINLRRDSDICVENLTQGFIGMAGWESLVLGQVVIARLDPVVEERYRDFCYGDKLPVRNVSGIDEMAKDILYLHNNKKLLAELKSWSKWWVNRYYSQDRLVRLWEKIYMGDNRGIVHHNKIL